MTYFKALLTNIKIGGDVINESYEVTNNFETIVK